MFDFLNKPYPFTSDLKYSLRLIAGVAAGIFLFILFFQPFDLNSADFDAYILTIAGFAGIVIILAGLVKIILPWAFRRQFHPDSWDLKWELLLLFLIWVLNSVAFAFYLAYVGKVPMTMYLAFKIVLLCLVMVVMMMTVNEIRNLRNRLEVMHMSGGGPEERAEKHPGEKPTIILHSDNRAEKLLFEPGALMLVRSAENYVEVIFREEGSVQKKLLRATMSSIEDQLRPFPGMVRCHRTCIVNTRAVTGLKRTSQGYRLRLAGYGEEIPVSRQYLLSVQGALEKPQ